MSSSIQPLIVALKQAVPLLIRTEPSTGDYLEGVLAHQDLKRCYELLAEALGPPMKDFTQAIRLDAALQPMVNAIGGIRLEQCLFIKRQEARIAYAALWPWASDPLKVTLKLGLYPRLHA